MPTISSTYPELADPIRIALHKGLKARGLGVDGGEVFGMAEEITRAALGGSEAVEVVLPGVDDREAAREAERRNTLASALRYVKLEAAAYQLVNRLLMVHEDADYQAVWNIAQAHRGPYRGMTYTDELEALRVLVEGA